MKIVSSGNGIRSPQFHKKKQRETRLRSVLWTVLVIVVIGTPVYLLRLEKFKISEVIVQGNAVTKTGEVESIISDLLSGNYLWIFPKSNALLYPKKDLRVEILEKIPRLVSVGLNLDGPKTLMVNVEERQPAALYCTGEDASSTNQECFFIDKSGYIFSEAPDFSGGVYTTYMKIPAIPSPVGEMFLEESKFTALAPFLSSLEMIDVRTEAFMIRDEEYHLLLPGGGEIMWKESADLEFIRSNLESFLSAPNIRKENDALSRILYIDMRFGQKIFYKFK